LGTTMVDGRRLTLVNIGSFSIRLTNDATSTAANRFQFSLGNYVLHPGGGTVQLVYDGTSSRWRLYGKNKLIASATLDFPSTAANAVSDLTITVTGALAGGLVTLAIPNGSVTATASFMAWVSAADTVTVRYSPKATEDPASGTFTVAVENV
jgi:hypothetical protein